ncbi:MBL fold metallo-hydrolase [Mycolicibacterium phocaicum]|uniref:MBL fold metallo-hydrolase n=1 Tax=Mycolicibacterium phocaicum TaxID=319706 RepID=A0A7I7ZSQ5_9MYCO|nr:MBL fold metallo-hydrolase [Mycolicibacterium phocaicum]TLH58559.1 MBL fold metallo-hydrolase [Mycolicibacterium phocaicum]UCZ60628.1 MBL fold metallo-hydrolase [Mycolicibacterium phocaicum]BBZ56719.1 MBL fold metallo-hydrolase [Mycolicibacterium phocaicum]
MRKVHDDLWETRTHSPSPAYSTHAYLWAAAPQHNALFYSMPGNTDLDEIAALGGVSDQYLSHRDEAGPALTQIAQRFSTRLHAPAAELLEIGQHAHIDVPLTSRHVDANGVEIIPTPGHSPGSKCYLVNGTQGTYLFTGDTLFRNASGDWAAGFFEGFSDPTEFAATLDLLATLEPDVVISSATPNAVGVHALSGQRWSDCVAQAASTLL